MKIVKITLFLVLIAGIGLTAVFFTQYSNNRERILPLPYYFTSAPAQTEIINAQEAKILIVGDKMAKALETYTKSIDEQVSSAFRRTNVVYNWADNHESLARTIYKLKSLKKLPPLIIYHGSSEEFFEDRFSLKDRNVILRNFKTYDNDAYLSLIITLPFLSKVIYQKDTVFPLGPRALKSNYEFAEGERILQKEVIYNLFKHEFQEFVELVKTSGSSLIVITNPINREIPPNEVCAETNTNSVIEYQQEIEDMLKKGNSKSAYIKLKELETIVAGNAQVYYLLASAALANGSKSEALLNFNKALSFDCNPKGGEPIFNQIILDESKKQGFAIVDFDLLNTTALGSEDFFIDNIYPHHLFYEKMLSELILTIKKSLNIK